MRNITHFQQLYADFSVTRRQLRAIVDSGDESPSVRELYPSEIFHALRDAAHALDKLSNLLDDASPHNKGAK